MNMPPPKPLGDWDDVLKAQGVWPRGDLKVWQETDSTQDLARAAARARGLMSCGTVFLSRHQREGRGRLGRNWQAPAESGLLFSFIAPPCEQPEALSIAVPVALHRALSPVLTTPLAIKWPNDLLAQGQGKLAGILIETEAGLPVVGIGLNTSLSEAQVPANLHGVATSTSILGCHHDDLTLLSSILHQLDLVLEDIQAGRLAALLTEWRSACMQMGQRLQLTHNGASIAGDLLDVDPMRGLLLRLPGGELVHVPSAGTTTR